MPLVVLSRKIVSRSTPRSPGDHNQGGAVIDKHVFNFVLDALLKRIADAEGEVGHLRAELDKARVEVVEEAANHEQQLAGVEAVRKQEVQALSEKVDEAEKHAAKYKRAGSKLKVDAKEKQAELSSLVETLQEELQSTRSQTGKAQAASEADMKREKAELEAEEGRKLAKQLQEELGEKSARLHEQEVKMQKHRADMDEAEREATLLRRELTAARQSHAVAQETADKQRADLSETIRDLQREMMHLKGQKKRADEWEREAKKFAAIRKDMLTTIDCLRGEVDLLKSQACDAALHVSEKEQKSTYASEAQMIRALAACRRLDGELICVN